MLAARDNKHNIVEKLLELGAVVTDRDKVCTEFTSLDTLWSLIRHCFSKPFFNYTRSPSNDLFAISSGSFATSNEMTFPGRTLINEDSRQNIRDAFSKSVISRPARVCNRRICRFGENFFGRFVGPTRSAAVFLFNVLANYYLN